MKRGSCLSLVCIIIVAIFTYIHIQGWYYGAGLYIIDLDHKGMKYGQLIGHMGWGNSFCYYDTLRGIAITGKPPKDGIHCLDL